MPINTYWEPDGIVYECKGVITAEESIESGDKFLQVPEGVTPKYQLVDCLQAEYFEISEMDMVDISADDLSASRKYPNIKVALVGKKGHVHDKFMNYLKVSWAINTSWEIRIFNSMESARDWLSHFAEMPESTKKTANSSSEDKIIKKK